MMAGASTGRFRGDGRVFSVRQRWSLRLLTDVRGFTLQNGSDTFWNISPSAELTQTGVLANKDLFVEKASAWTEPFRSSRE